MGVDVGRGLEGVWRIESAGRVDCKGRNRGRIGRWMGVGSVPHAI